MNTKDLETYISTIVYRELNSFRQADDKSLPLKKREFVKKKIVKEIMTILEQAKNNLHNGPSGSEETPFTSIRNKLTPFWNLPALVKLSQKEKITKGQKIKIFQLMLDEANNCEKTKKIILDILSHMETNSIILK